MTSDGREHAPINRIHAANAAMVVMWAYMESYQYTPAWTMEGFESFINEYHKCKKKAAKQIINMAGNHPLMREAASQSTDDEYLALVKELAMSFVKKINRVEDK